MTFWVWAPFILVGGCQSFGEAFISIFRAEVAMVVREGIYVGLMEEKSEGQGIPSS
jgi:hypothetical protein